MRFVFSQDVAVYRLTQAGAQSSYGGSPTATVKGYLRPLDEEQSALNGIEQFGTGFKLLTESGADIEVTDKLVIDSETYLVKGKKSINRGAISYDSFLLTLPDND